jgi:hypothetical protein
MRDAVSRAQLLWGLGGVIIGFGTLLLMFLGGTLGLIHNLGIFNLASAFATTVMGSMLAVAILRYRLFDIDVILRRTLVYAVLTAALALAYFGSVLVLQGVFQAVTGESRSELVTVLSTLAIAALFVPLRGRVQRAIDRRFYRKKYDAARTLAAFGAQARDVVELEQLSGQLLRVVDETMQPAHASLWLRPIERRSAHDAPHPAA